MLKAYDTFLQAIVHAKSASENGGSEAYRYECAHCGEEVRLAAVGSKSMVAHFRHRRGNNNVDCEKYLGQHVAIGVDSRSQRIRNIRAEFYFDSNSETFLLSLCFNEDEINMYEDASAKFELSVSTQSQAFCTLAINKINCMPDIPILIPINCFSYDYFLSNTLDNTKKRYTFFKKDDSPIFFKILGNDSEYRAKLVCSTILYTNVPYFVVTDNNSLLRTNHLPNEIEISYKLNFETMNRSFTGQVITIKNKTSDIESLLSSWGYQIETSESLTLLWPPAAQIGEVSVVCSNEAFLFSSFKLKPHGNINISSMDITEIGSDISNISIHSKVKILRKNVEFIIDKQKIHPVYHKALPLEETFARTYKVQGNGTCYLFNRSGTTLIGDGSLVSLTPKSLIRRYDSGYLSEIIYPLKQNELSGAKLLNDLLAHYKRTESFSSKFFTNLELSATALKYIEECAKTGVINSAAKRFIEEGQL